MATRAIVALDIPRNDWEHILKVLKTCAGSATFDQWFAPIRFVSAHDAEIRVVLPSSEFRDELLEHHENMINYGKSCAGLHAKRLIYLTPQEFASLSSLSTPVDLCDPARLL